MLKRIKTVALSGVASLLTFVAMSGVSPNSWWILYEPDLPEELKFKG